MKERIREYATDESGNNPLVEVWSWRSAHSNQQHFHQNGSFLKKVNGTSPLPDQKVIYVDGGFDLFSTGHIEFLKQVVETEEKQAKQTGWDKEYSPIYVVAGVHSDEDINDYKGINYPIMNIFERGLCVLQCKVSIVSTHISAPNTYTTHSISRLSSSWRPQFPAKPSWNHYPTQSKQSTTAPQSQHLLVKTSTPMQRRWVFSAKSPHTHTRKSTRTPSSTAFLRAESCTRNVNASRASRVLEKRPCAEERRWKGRKQRKTRPRAHKEVTSEPQ